VGLYKNTVVYVREDGYIKIVGLDKDRFDLSKAKQFKTVESKISKGSIVLLPKATNGVSTGYGVFVN
jgi:hypothetical protein